MSKIIIEKASRTDPVPASNQQLQHFQTTSEIRQTAHRIRMKVLTGAQAHIYRRHTRRVHRPVALRLPVQLPPRPIWGSRLRRGITERKLLAGPVPTEYSAAAAPKVIFVVVDTMPPYHSQPKRDDDISGRVSYGALEDRSDQQRFAR